MNAASCGATLSRLSVTHWPWPLIRSKNAVTRLPGVLTDAQTLASASRSVTILVCLWGESWPILPEAKP